MKFQYPLVIMLMLLSFLLALISAAGFVAVIRALTVDSTLSAVESAFGSLVIALLFLVLAKKAWRSARHRMTEHNSTPE